MSTETHDPSKHPKQDFQVERLAFFSDAVFAIAITLLVIDFKVPEVNSRTTLPEVIAKLEALKPNILALLFSFALISGYWIKHHFLFKHIDNYNKQIVIVNMFVLLPIIFLPFTTTFVANCFTAYNTDVLRLAMRIWLVNHIFVCVAIYLLYFIAVVQHKEFSFRMEPKEKVKFTIDTLVQTLLLIAAVCIMSIPDPNQHGTLILILGIAILAIKPITKRYLKWKFEKGDV
jgi:uncharacterized membrane protein